MARISPKNIRYRTKGEIARDVSYILSCDELHMGTKLAVVDQVFWVWSEFDGKYKGCRYWSAKARNSKPEKGGLIHEHMVPRKIVREKLLELTKPTPQLVEELLNKWCVGVVVTKKEDNKLNELRLGSRMPDGWDGENPKARYLAAGIDIADHGD